VVSEVRSTLGRVEPQLLDRKVRRAADLRTVEVHEHRRDALAAAGEVHLDVAAEEVLVLRELLPVRAEGTVQCRQSVGNDAARNRRRARWMQQTTHTMHVAVRAGLLAKQLDVLASTTTPTTAASTAAAAAAAASTAAAARWHSGSVALGCPRPGPVASS
jgi:hypothetical protein